MFEKIKKIFSNKEKRVENLVSLLIILVITLIIINKILKNDETNSKNFENEVGVELAQETPKDNLNDLEIRLEKILSKINGVGKVSVLLTYTESSSIIPIYSENNSISTTEEIDTSGGKRTIETQNNQKDIITDSSSNIITQKIIMPTVEGAIITAQGANDSVVKGNIIAAVEAVTGVANHKIQVFEMGDD